jgi:hypothetical protein
LSNAYQRYGLLHIVNLNGESSVLLEFGHFFPTIGVDCAVLHEALTATAAFGVGLNMKTMKFTIYT